MSCETKINIFKTEEKLIHFAIEKWRDLATHAIMQKGRFTVALSGGKSPVELYKSLAKHKEDLPWDKTHIFMVDERFVPIDHPKSNAKMIKETLIDPLGLSDQQFHHMPVEEDEVETAAEKYEEHLKTFFRPHEHTFPSFSLILLGLGEDGHTASLFPDHPAVIEKNRWVMPIKNDKLEEDRISMTLPLINHAKQVGVIAIGENKARMIRKILHKEDSFLPIARVKPKDAKLCFLLDQAAASRLS